jgi:aminoglycoside phosphotransferase (APT) family kinase protein
MSHTDATVATPHGTELTDAELRRLDDALQGSGITLAGPLEIRLMSGGRSNLTYRLTDVGEPSSWTSPRPPDTTAMAEKKLR